MNFFKVLAHKMIRVHKYTEEKNKMAATKLDQIYTRSRTVEKWIAGLKKNNQR